MFGKKETRKRNKDPHNLQKMRMQDSVLDLVRPSLHQLCNLEVISFFKEVRSLKELKIEFRGEALNRLEKLRKRTKAISKVQVVKNSLRVLSTLESLKEEDGSILVIRDGKRFRLVLPK